MREDEPEVSMSPKKELAMAELAEGCGCPGDGAAAGEAAAGALVVGEDGFLLPAA